MHNSNDGSVDDIKGRLVAELRQHYDEGFSVTPEYRETLPDLQNGENTSPRVAIQHVGIHNFKLPMQIRTREGGEILIHCAVTGTVSLDAHNRGINMSRIIRTFYEYESHDLHPDTLQKAVKDYLDRLESSSARLGIAFDYPVKQTSLRSGLVGYQYYPVVLETVITPDKGVRQTMHLDFEYSSACPCSYELSVHASLYKGVAAVPHSQRSIARVAIEFNDFVWIEDLVDLCRDALKTETQVMVKREDEQAFAELNAANLKFVEDAVRQLYTVLNRDERILDFRIFASHEESLHSHDAISVLVKGRPDGFEAVIPPFGIPRTGR